MEKSTFQITGVPVLCSKLEFERGPLDDLLRRDERLVMFALGSLPQSGRALLACFPLKHVFNPQHGYISIRSEIHLHPPEFTHASPHPAVLYQGEARVSHVRPEARW